MKGKECTLIGALIMSIALVPMIASNNIRLGLAITMIGFVFSTIGFFQHANDHPYRSSPVYRVAAIMIIVSAFMFGVGVLVLGGAG